MCCSNVIFIINSGGGGGSSSNGSGSRSSSCSNSQWYYNNAWSRRACFGSDANATTSPDRQQKTVHYLYNATRRPVHQIINCRDCGRTVPRDCGQTVPRDCGRTVPRDCRDCGRLTHRLIDVSYTRDLALWHGAVSRWWPTQPWMSSGTCGRNNSASRGLSKMAMAAWPGRREATKWLTLPHNASSPQPWPSPCKSKSKWNPGICYSRPKPQHSLGNHLKS